MLVLGALPAIFKHVKETVLYLVLPYKLLNLGDFVHFAQDLDQTTDHEDGLSFYLPRTIIAGECNVSKCSTFNDSLELGLWVHDDVRKDPKWLFAHFWILSTDKLLQQSDEVKLVFLINHYMSAQLFIRVEEISENLQALCYNFRVLSTLP